MQRISTWLPLLSLFRTSAWLQTMSYFRKNVINISFSLYRLQIPLHDRPQSVDVGLAEALMELFWAARRPITAKLCSIGVKRQDVAVICVFLTLQQGHLVFEAELPSHVFWWRIFDQSRDIVAVKARSSSKYSHYLLFCFGLKFVDLHGHKKSTALYKILLSLWTDRLRSFLCIVLCTHLCPLFLSLHFRQINLGTRIVL